MNKNLTTITLFKNGEKEIYLKAKDVAKMLGYENTNKAIKDHVCDEFIIEYKDFPGGNESLPLQPHTKFLLEPGFYQIALSSKLQSAKNFQKWVIKDVIPTLRKTGKYEIKTPLEILQSINYSDIEKLENGEYWKYKIN